MTRVEYYILRSAYPPNSSIILDRATTGGIPAGSTGKVVNINKDMDTISVNFDNGIQRNLIYGKDYFHRNIRERYRY